MPVIWRSGSVAVMDATRETCPGCGGLFAPQDGPVHDYMISSPACWHGFGCLLACEYGDPALMDVHRLSVDTYAVQHPGNGLDRRAIQSVGLHLARLLVQLETPQGPRETNEVMLGFAARKDSLRHLAPPDRFTLTIADIAPFSGGPRHAGMVREWAASTWDDWHKHHGYIRGWVAEGAPGLR